VRDLAVLFVHLIATVAKLLGRGGARSVVANSLLLKHQLLILNRSRERAPKPSMSAASRTRRRPHVQPIRRQPNPGFLRFISAAQGRPLPRYVEDEFEAYLKCGRLEEGFLADAGPAEGRCCSSL